MEVNTKDFKYEEVSVSHGDLPSVEKQYFNTNLDLHKFDVTLPHEMCLKKFNFSTDGETLPSNLKVQSEFDESTDELENDNNRAQFTKKLETFYKDMKAKLKLLKSTPIIKSKAPSVASGSSKEDINDKLIDQTFQNLKKTPETQEKLKHIQELDSEIGSIINEYKAEREQRLQTQLELCNDIYEHNLYFEKDTQSFLDLCNFEMSDEADNPGDIDDIESIDTSDSNAEKKNEEKLNKKQSFSIIKRNIEMAKTGTLAGSSLTDEEKNRIEVLLEMDEAKLKLQNSEQSIDANDYADYTSCTTLNAYSFSESETVQLVDIAEKLEKFAEDEKNTEKQKFCNIEDDFILKQALKKINDQLIELQSKELELNEYKRALYDADDGDQNPDDILEMQTNIYDKDYENDELKKGDYGVEFINEREASVLFRAKDEKNNEIKKLYNESL